jgi:cytochrome c oxidase cbb3-type subunit 3/ubiquinol-cytochrome c reductase cytochrome c subunit
VAFVVAFCIGSGDLECGPPLTGAPRRGQELYRKMCAVCHGATGEGYAADDAPSLVSREWLASASDDFIRAAIAQGRRGTTMSSWSVKRAGPLSDADVDAVVAFLRTAQEPRLSNGPVHLDERPLSGDAAAGVDVFAKNCAGCHGARGVGGSAVHIGGLDFLQSASNGFLRYAVARGRHGTAMPAFLWKLGPSRIDGVVAALRGWQASMPPHSAGIARAAPLPLGPTPLHPSGPEPEGFHADPATTPVDVVKGQLDRGARMGILDARAPSDYLGSHISGAVSVPFYDPDPYLALLPKDTWLVCYCGCPHAESGQLAHKLVAHGFKKVTVLDEGINAWRARGYAMGAGVDP